MLNRNIIEKAVKLKFTAFSIKVKGDFALMGVNNLFKVDSGTFD